MTQTLEHPTTVDTSYAATHQDAAPQTCDQIRFDAYSCDQVTDKLIYDLADIESHRDRIGAIAALCGNNAEQISESQDLFLQDVTFASVVDLSRDALSDTGVSELADVYALATAYDAAQAYLIPDNYRNITPLTLEDLDRITTIPSDEKQRQEIIARSLKAVLKDATMHEDEVHSQLEDSGALPLQTPTGRTIDDGSMFDDITYALINAANQHSPITTEIISLRVAAQADSDSTIRIASLDRVAAAKETLAAAHQTLADIRAYAHDQPYAADDDATELIHAYAAAIEAEHELKEAEDILASVPYPVATSLATETA